MCSRLRAEKEQDALTGSGRICGRRLGTYRVEVEGGRWWERKKQEEGAAKPCRMKVSHPERYFLSLRLSQYFLAYSRRYVQRY
jgi:hypothetical protein